MVKPTLKQYFVNPDNQPTYIMAEWVQIYRGKLQFWVADKKVREFEIHEGLHFDNLNNFDKGD